MMVILVITVLVFLIPLPQTIHSQVFMCANFNGEERIDLPALQTGQLIKNRADVHNGSLNAQIVNANGNKIKRVLGWTRVPADGDYAVVLRGECVSYEMRIDVLE